MLEKLDLKSKVPRNTYRAACDEFERRLGILQREVVGAGIPVLLVFEGFDAAGKGTVINNLLQALDPRGFRVWTIKPPTEEEARHPFLWRFWTRTPARGRFAIFDCGWHRQIMDARARGLSDDRTLNMEIADVRSFERELADDGAVVVKFFLHISKKEQKKRFAALSADSATAWRVTKEDRRRHKDYRKYLQAAEEMLAATDDRWAPWTPVAAHDQRSATLAVFRTVVRALERRLAVPGKAAGKRPGGCSPRAAAVLKTVDLTRTMSRMAYDAVLEKKQEALRRLEYEIYMVRVPVIIVFEGWDAAGKGGCIRRLTRRLDPRGYEVAPFGVPTTEEKAHHYLWRFWRAMPKDGHMTIFDRSWYGRVLVERVEGFCTPAEWTRAYREISEMEQSLANAGAVILKFWLHIDMAEQLRRFRARERTAEKQWKITDEDWRNRRHRKEYEAAVGDMLRLTSTRSAPWTVVESNCKEYARIKVLDTTIRAISRRLGHS